MRDRTPVFWANNLSARQKNSWRERRIQQTEGKQGTPEEDNQVGFSSQKIREAAGLPLNISSRDIKPCLGKYGYNYIQSRKKRLLSANDRTLRTKFARKNFPPDFWMKDNAFYLAGVGFAFKPNPAGEASAMSSLTCQKPNKGLAIITKGRKEGSGGKMANFFVAISHGNGVVMCHHHDWKITGDNFARWEKWISTAPQLPPRRMSEKKFKGCRKAWTRKGYEMVKIPACSPDLNPIENFFHLVRTKMRSDAIQNNITKETYKQFVERGKKM